MALTEELYTGDGSTVLFPFTFEYVKQADVKVSLDSVATTAYSFANATTIEMDSAPASGVSVRVYRDTDTTNKAEFVPGSAIRAQDLNKNFDLALFRVEEGVERSVRTDGSATMSSDLDMGGNEIINLSAPTSDGAAVNKFYVDSRLGDLDIPGFTRWRYNAAGGETSLSGVGSTGGTLAYSPNREQVFLNGAQLQRGIDYTADNGTTITLPVALLAGDVVEVICVNNLNTGTTAQAQDVYWNQSGSGAITRTVESKLRDVVSVKDFGAVGDGVTDDMPYFQAMATTLGYIVVGKGTFALNVATSTPTIDVPIYFQEGGGITVPTGRSLTFRNRIAASPKQQIFYGDGTIYFKNDNALGIGEDSKHSYAAWWGIFPVGQVNTIQTALINKALSAYTAQVREGIFELDCGSYRIDGTIVIPRGVWLKGSSTRRTIIDLVGAGFTALQSGGSAVWISGIHFEQPAGSEAYFDGIQIELLHDTPKIEDVLVWNAKVGIRLGPNASLATIKDVRGIYGYEPVGGYTSDSSTILVESDRFVISNINVSNTTHGPSALIRIKPSSSNSTSGSIDNLVTTEDSIPVDIVSDASYTASEIAINNIVKSDGSTSLPAVKLTTASSGTIRNVTISNVVATGNTDSVLSVIQGSSEKIEGISLSTVAANYSTPSGGTKAATLVQTAGTLNLISFGSDVSVGNFTEPISVTGDVSRLSVPNNLLPKLVLADDTVGQFAPIVRGGLLLVKNNGSGGAFPNITSSGAILYDAGASPTISKVFGGANFATLSSGTVPTGTTGTDGNLNVSSTNGVIYVENRTGGSIEVTLAYL